jgi:hypothetical protein
VLRAPVVQRSLTILRNTASCLLFHWVRLELLGEAEDPTEEQTGGTLAGGLVSELAEGAEDLEGLLPLRLCCLDSPA